MIDQKTAPYAGLLLRVALGVMFVAHGFYLKIFVFTVGGTVGFFESLGLPAVLAYATIAAPPGCTQAMAGCSPPRAAAGSIRCS